MADTIEVTIGKSTYYIWPTFDGSAWYCEMTNKWGQDVIEPTGDYPARNDAIDEAKRALRQRFGQG